MGIIRKGRVAGFVLVIGTFLVVVGCYNAPNVTPESAESPAPLRLPSPATETDSGTYEDSLTGGQVFTMYCSYCHNAPALSERPYAQFRNVAAHMRVRANLTGKEYAKVLEFMRRWNDVPGPEGVPAPSPKRLIFSQPLSELRPPAEEKQAPPADGK